MHKNILLFLLGQIMVWLFDSEDILNVNPQYSKNN